MSSLPLLLFNWCYADSTLNLGLLWHYQPEQGHAATKCSIKGWFQNCIWVN
jgi:hypothetical protein